MRVGGVDGDGWVKKMRVWGKVRWGGGGVG